MKTKRESTQKKLNPKILIVTPEITYLPSGMGNVANYLRAKAGGLADVSACLVSALFDNGADVHVALPHYRRIFNIDVSHFLNHELRVYKKVLPDSRIHLAQDRVFFYRDEIYDYSYIESRKIALAFQREVINNIIPQVNPDIVHCNDWMTGLIPAACRRINIPCLTTIHNIHTQEIPLGEIEESGIDADEFWKYLYYTHYPPYNPEESRWNNPVDLLASAIFASHFVNTVSPTFLREICEGKHNFIPSHVRAEISNKTKSGCAFGILNAPGPEFNPETDKLIEFCYSSESHVDGKRQNKIRLQQKLGLIVDPNAPLFFWPSRLDPAQKGCQLLADIMYGIVSSYWHKHLQIVIVANGAFQKHFHDIVRLHDFYERVAVCDFDERLSHMGYASADFLIMPSLFEPCGLPQMIGIVYGVLPIVHDTGGLHDTVSHLNTGKHTGNGFVFTVYDSNGLRWAIDEAMKFYGLPTNVKKREITRIMKEGKQNFTYSVTSKRYMELYEAMLKRPLINLF